MKIRHTAITSLAGVALLASASAALAATDSVGSVESKSQGIYSTDQLMDANVYADGDSQNSIGHISDVLLDNDMKVKSFVVETKGKYGVGGGKSFVVEPSDISVKTKASSHASKPTYVVDLDVTRNKLASYPVYNDSWWSNAQTQASDAWQSTKQSASSAWTKVKNTTSNIMNNPRDKADTAADKTSDAASNAADKTQNAADNAADDTSDAAQNATNNN